MNIKKVDDKPMIIHTKEKAEIHIVKSKKSDIKDSETLKKSKGHMGEWKSGMKNVQQSIKTKGSSIKVVGAAGANNALNQMEGGDEVKDAAMVAYGATRPVAKTISKGANLINNRLMQKQVARIKKVDAGKNLARKKAKQSASNIAKNSSKQAAKTAAKETAKATSKETAKVIAKETAKTVAGATATTVTTTAGTTISPGVGTLIGIAAGYAVGAEIEKKDGEMVRKNRMIKFFLDKMNSEDQQKDSLLKLVKDLIISKVMTKIKIVGPIVGLFFLLLALVVAITVTPVVVAVGVVYNSPFAIFFPPLEEGDTVLTVTSAYVSAFNREVSTLASEHAGYDEGMIVYVDYEGETSNPSNYYDILAVYMVKYGIGKTAIIMNDTSKGWIRSVVNDMCTYTTSSGTEEVVTENDDGTTTTTSKTILYVNVTLKSYTQMISQYGFDSDQEQILREMMKPENLALIGYTGGADSGGGLEASTLSETEIAAILADIPEGNAKKACEFALRRVGYPYSQELRHSGKYYDCSSLVYYAWKDAGVDISYGGATTAAYEALGLANSSKTEVYEQLQPGDLIFYSFEKNGAYLNITHVGIYVGNGKMVDAKGTAYGVVYRDVVARGSIVLIGRP